MDQVGREHAAADVVRVIRVTVVGPRMGCRAAPAVAAAACNAAKPPHETPIMPTGPLHHDCAAIHAIAATPSWVPGRVLVREAVGITGAAQVDP